MMTTIKESSENMCSANSFYYANERSHHNFEIRWKNCSFLLISARFHKQNGQEPPRLSQHINNTYQNVCKYSAFFKRPTYESERVEMLRRCIECRETLPGISIEISLLLHRVVNLTIDDPSSQKEHRTFLYRARRI